MKKKYTIIIINIVVLILFSVGCSDKNMINPVVSANVNTGANTTNNQAAAALTNTNVKNSYINTRFSYKVSYPKDWEGIIESETQDGALLYYKDDNDVRTFADNAGNDYINTEKAAAKSEGKNVSDFYTDNGDKGIIITGDEKGKKLTHVIVVYNGVHYDFYTLVSSDFYKNNEAALTQIGKSIKFLSKT